MKTDVYLRGPVSPWASGGIAPADELPPREGEVAQRVVVIDGCSYGRLGLVSALRTFPFADGTPVDITGYASPASLVQATRDMARHCRVGQPGPPVRGAVMVVRLPAAPQAALDLLLQLGAVPVRQLPVSRLVLLSPYPGDVVLTVLVGTGCPWPVQVVASDLSLANLRGVLHPVVHRGRRRARSAGAPGSWPLCASSVPLLPRLSERERLVLWYSVQAVPVYTQARRRSLSHKTLYSQRAQALHKLGVTSVGALLRGFVLSRFARGGHRVPGPLGYTD